MIVIESVEVNNKSFDLVEIRANSDTYCGRYEHFRHANDRLPIISRLPVYAVLIGHLCFEPLAACGLLSSCKTDGKMLGLRYLEDYKSLWISYTLLFAYFFLLEVEVGQNLPAQVVKCTIVPCPL